MGIARIHTDVAIRWQVPQFLLVLRWISCYGVHMYTSEHTPASSTLTVRLKSSVRDDLDRLCSQTKRTRSFLAAEAIEAYVAYETAIARGVERGLKDMRANRVVSHAAAMDQLDAEIARVARAKP